MSLTLLRCKILPGPSCCQVQKFQFSKSSCHPKLSSKSSRIECVRYDVDELDDLGKRSKRVQLDLFQLALACWRVTLPYVRRAMLKSSAQMAVSQRRK